MASDHQRLTARSAPRTLLAAAVGAGLAAALGLPAGPAAADPTVGEIEKQIDTAWNKLEPVIEQHNAVRTQLADKRRAAGAFEEKIKPLAGKVDAAMARVGQFASVRYRGGNVNAMNAVLTSGSPTSLVRQLGIIDQFARRQSAQVADAARLRAQYQEKKAPLDALIADLAKSEAALKLREDQINAEVKNLEKMRLKAYGNSGGTGSLRPAPCPATYPGGPVGKVIRFACSQIGKPYVWAAEGPGSYDCSGLTLAAWRQAGVGLPHNAAAQRRAMRSVSKSELRAGDLVFYYGDLHHVAIYAGKSGGVHWMVHAPSSGDVVRMAHIDEQPIHSFGRPKF
ncbi:hypothetical protein GCM10010124_29720 [Pilimelia terevasa]|uniref:NlpC/P60 domain-containing protein n=1 Tax=Pilimelia terevasa TaxID=53372 RepID=A0A8J3FJW4_9ACTN|nr:C40 family peptidase [Pilimelia terevasa]GGK35096.1 hypothetical protein GCM10010124_29720 [Pilimelia terevasa]